MQVGPSSPGFWSNVDWAATGLWMQAFAALMGAGAVAYAAHVGSSTFGDWLKQRQTERKIAAGERIISFLYKAKRAFPAIRSVQRLTHETRQAGEALAANHPGFATLPEPQRRRLEAAQVILTRVQNEEALWAELFECLPLSRAFFGLELERAIESIWNAQARISAAAKQYGRTDPNAPGDGKLERDFWVAEPDEAVDADDEVGLVIERAIAVGEKLILPVIAGTGAR